MKLKIGILALDIALYKSYDFYSGQIRTLVAMATYSSHCRLKVTYMLMTLATSLVVLLNCYATADILTNFLL